MSAKLYTYEEIAKHNSRTDLYMVIDGKVYDITTFQDEVNIFYLCCGSTTLLIVNIFLQHPGGEEVLLDEGAKDATGAFDDVGHSEDARDMLKKYYVGDVDPTVS